MEQAFAVDAGGNGEHKGHGWLCAQNRSKGREDGPEYLRLHRQYNGLSAVRSGGVIVKKGEGTEGSQGFPTGRAWIRDSQGRWIGTAG
jgi:hypothetical protein